MPSPRADLDDESASDAGSISDSGFSPISSAAKGKGKSTEVGGVDYKVFSITRLMEEQQTAIDYVKDMLGLKVGLPLLCSIERRTGWGRARRTEGPSGVIDRKSVV